MNITTGTIKGEIIETVKPNVKGEIEMNPTKVESKITTENMDVVEVESFTDASSNLWINGTTAIELNFEELTALKQALETHLEWLVLINE